MEKRLCERCYGQLDIFAVNFFEEDSSFTLCFRCINDSLKSEVWWGPMVQRFDKIREENRLIAMVKEIEEKKKKIKDKYWYKYK